MSPIRLKKLWKGDVSALVERIAQAARAPIVVLDEREADVPQGEPLLEVARTALRTQA